MLFRSLISRREDLTTPPVACLKGTARTLLWTGSLSTSTRRVGFRRLIFYDLQPHQDEKVSFVCASTEPAGTGLGAVCVERCCCEKVSQTPRIYCVVFADPPSMLQRYVAKTQLTYPPEPPTPPIRPLIHRRSDGPFCTIKIVVRP